ncbi:MAG TPA: DUF4178 domain-containing protein [Myxococcota bacterium]
MLFFFALSCLAAATFSSVVLYQKGERRRQELGGVADPRLLLPFDGEPGSSSSSSSSSSVAPPPVSTPPARAGEPTLENLQHGDVVEDGPDDYLVVGSIRYREEKDLWALHVVDAGTRQRLLEVRRRHGQLVVAFLDVAAGLPSGQLFSGLSFAGHAFSLEGRGDARTTVDGDTSALPLSTGGVLAWTRYTGAGGALLLVEDDGATRRAFIGQQVPAASLSIMSGELNR